jgi:hypothetical protein
MRFSGAQIAIDPAQMPYVTERYAGQVVKENPGLADRIVAGLGILQSESEQPTGADDIN